MTGVHSGTRRRGAAMLLALMAVVVVSAAALGLARSVTQRRLAYTTDRDRLMADDLVDAAEDRVLHWLRDDAPQARTRVDARVPEVLVLDEAWNTNRSSYRVTVTAFDQAGMLHADLLSSPLAMALPLAEAPVDDPASIDGLDVMAAAAGPRSVFPKTASSEPVWFGRSDPETFALGPDEPEQLAWGAIIATHPSQRDQRGDRTYDLNVMTAPRPLLDAISAEFHIDLEPVLSARSADAAPPPPPLGDTTFETASGVSIRLVTSSPCWAFRVDCEVDRLRRSWWAVYERTQQRWERVQTLLIDG